MIEDGTPIIVNNSTSGYKGKGLIIGLAYANVYLIQTNDPDKPIITVKFSDFEVTGPPEIIEDPKKTKKKDKIPPEALEGRRDYDSSPTDGKKTGKSKKGNGKRLARRRNRNRMRK